MRGMAGSRLLANMDLAAAVSATSVSVFRISDLFRISSFGFSFVLFVSFVVFLDGDVDGLPADSAKAQLTGESNRRTVCSSDFFCFNPSMQQVGLAFVDGTCNDLEPWYPRPQLEETTHALGGAAKQIRTRTAFAKATRYASSPA